MSVHCSITVHWPHIGLQMTTLSVEAVSAIHCNFRWLNPASTSGEAFRSREIAPRVWCGTGSRGLMPLVCFNMMASFWAQWAKRNPLQIPILGPPGLAVDRAVGFQGWVWTLSRRALPILPSLPLGRKYRCSLVGSKTSVLFHRTSPPPFSLDAPLSHDALALQH